MPRHDDELPSIDVADLESVSGGLDMSSMMLPMLLAKQKQQAMPPQVAAPPTPAAPPQPKILVNGQPAQMDASGHINIDPEDI